MESKLRNVINVSAVHLCPDCDGQTTTEWRASTYLYGAADSAVEIAVDLPVRRCGTCGFEFVDDEGERLKHDALCRHLGVLSPNEIRGIRRRHGMSRAEFAGITGLGEATIGRWERGAGIQSVANDRYLRMLGQRDGVSRLSSVLRSKDRPAQSAPSGVRFRALLDVEKVRRDQRHFELVIVHEAA